MALDMAKYRALFLEEATDHLAEMSRALLELEKDAASVESIDLVFRMAHSIKSMAASVGYDAITEVSHALEDRMQEIRGAGGIDAAGDPQALGALFRGLEGLERMIATVRDEDVAPEPEPELVASLKPPAIGEPAAAPADAEPAVEPAAPSIAVTGSPPEKKALS